MILLHKVLTKKNCSFGEHNSNICKDVVIKMGLMQPQDENDLHKDVEL